MLEKIGVVVFEAEFASFRIVEVSPSVEVVLGYSVAECKDAGFILERLIHPDDTEAAAARIMEVFEHGRVDVGFRALHSDGSILPLSGFVDRTRDEDNPHFGGILCAGGGRTLSAGVTEDRLELALDSADMGVWDWSLAEWTIFWSDQVYRLHGSTREELGDLFESYPKLVERIHTESAAGAGTTVTIELPIRQRSLEGQVENVEDDAA